MLGQRSPEQWRSSCPIGPGHPAVMSDEDGTVLIYHYYTPSGAARLGINLLGFDSAGWPFVY